jgi:uncharacterized membrane protein YfhO
MQAPLAPGWTGRLDGVASPILLTNVAGMGIVVPDGSHDVSWTYSPPGLWPGVAATILGLAACAALMYTRKR